MNSFDANKKNVYIFPTHARTLLSATNRFYFKKKIYIHARVFKPAEFTCTLYGVHCTVYTICFIFGINSDHDSFLFSIANFWVLLNWKTKHIENRWRIEKKTNCWQMFHLKMLEFFFVGIFLQHPSQIQKGKNDTDFYCLLQKFSSLQECDKNDFSLVNRSNEMKINLNKTRAIK